jgi:hypothetical protein
MNRKITSIPSTKEMLARHDHYRPVDDGRAAPALELLREVGDEWLTVESRRVPTVLSIRDVLMLRLLASALLRVVRLVRRGGGVRAALERMIHRRNPGLVDVHS